MIWNTNHNFTDPAVVRKEMAASFQSLVSKGLDPFLIPGDPQSTFDYTIGMIVNGMFDRSRQGARPNEGGFELAHQQEVLQFLCDNGRRLPELTPRFAWKLAMARRHDPDWEATWSGYLQPRSVHPGLILPDSVPQLISPSMRRAIDPQPPTPDPQPPIDPLDPARLDALQQAVDELVEMGLVRAVEYRILDENLIEEREHLQYMLAHPTGG